LFLPTVQSLLDVAGATVSSCRGLFRISQRTVPLVLFLGAALSVARGDALDGDRA
jgi:hypothetical protein